MKKYRYMVFIILGVIVCIALIGGGTYAYLLVTTDRKNINTNTGKLEVVYNISDDITGELLPSSSSSGLKATATARITADSVPAYFNIYINPIILDGLNVPALKWSVIGTMKSGKGISIMYTNSGDFSGAKEGEAIKIVDSYQLDTTVTSFTIQIWLDGSLMTESIVGKRFKADITSDSVPITSEF